VWLRYDSVSAIWTLYIYRKITIIVLCDGDQCFTNQSVLTTWWSCRHHCDPAVPLSDLRTCSNRHRSLLTSSWLQNQNPEHINDTLFMSQTNSVQLPYMVTLLWKQEKSKVINANSVLCWVGLQNATTSPD